MARHKDFWQLTEDGLDYATKSLKLSLTSEKRTQLMDVYLSLAAFPDVKPGLEALKRRGLRLAILSNGEPKMLQAAATSAGISPLLDGIISVEEVNIFKPSPRVYALAPTRLNVSASEIGFVSSNSWDVNGAAVDVPRIRRYETDFAGADVQACRCEGVDPRAGLENVHLLDTDNAVEQGTDAGAGRGGLQHLRLAVGKNSESQAASLERFEAGLHVRKGRKAQYASMSCVRFSEVRLSFRLFVA